MTAFFASFLSSSPNAFPTIFSYCPTPVQVYPLKLGDSFAVSCIFFTRAWAGRPAYIPHAATMKHAEVMRMNTRIRASSLAFIESDEVTTDFEEASIGSQLW